MGQVREHVEVPRRLMFRCVRAGRVSYVPCLATGQSVVVSPSPFALFAAPASVDQVGAAYLSPGSLFCWVCLLSQIKRERVEGWVKSGSAWRFGLGLCLGEVVRGVAAESHVRGSFALAPVFGPSPVDATGRSPMATREFPPQHSQGRARVVSSGRSLGALPLTCPIESSRTIGCGVSGSVVAFASIRD